MSQHLEPEDRWPYLMRLLTPHQERLRTTARRLARTATDGDDLFQETVLRAFHRIGDLRDEARFPGWIYTVLLSVHRSRARREFWRRFLPLDRETERDLPRTDPAGGIDEERWRAERASRALAHLPAVQREAVVLFEIDGFSIEEIAAFQEASVPAVKSRLQRGRARLHRHYQKVLTVEERGRGLADPAPPAGIQAVRQAQANAATATEHPLGQGGTS